MNVIAKNNNCLSALNTPFFHFFILILFSACNPGSLAQNDALKNTNEQMTALEGLLAMDPSACLDYLTLCERAQSICVMIEGTSDIKDACNDIASRCQNNLKTYCSDQSTEKEQVEQPDASVVSPCGDGVCKDGETCGSCARDCGACTPQTITIAAIADSYVDQGSSSSNFGQATSLKTDQGPDQQLLIRFSIDKYPDAFQSATLRIYVSNKSSNGPKLYLTNNDWSENSVNWNNRPQPMGDLITDLKTVSTGWLEIDVSKVITKAGEYSFIMIPTSSDGTDFTSRESANKPELLMVTSGTSVPPTSSADGSVDPDPAMPPSDAPDTTGNHSGDPILVGAGDIATDNMKSEQTAKILDKLFSTTSNGFIFTAGDNSNEDGTPEQFATQFNPTWGRHKIRLRPSPGNHDYHTSGASGYFGYFGAAAGPKGKGYYSYNLGAWHIISLNGNCSEIGGCGRGSPQEQWLRADLAQNTSACTLAYWHQPRFSSGSHSGTTSVQGLWQALYDYGAEVVLGGHNHLYERFKPQTPTGEVDLTKGIRQFVVGTGGAGVRGEGATADNLEAHESNTLGVLKLTLHQNSYDWEFIPVDGKSYTDSGHTSCH